MQYRRAALHSASPIGVILMLYDQMVKDLRRAMLAMREERPEACANEIKHALLVIQQLEGSMDRDAGEEIVTWLLRYYGQLRSNIIESQVQRSPELMEKQIASILDIRAAWQERERIDLAATAAPVAVQAAQYAGGGNSSNDATEYGSSSWSA